MHSSSNSVQREVLSRGAGADEQECKHEGDVGDASHSVRVLEMMDLRAK